LKPAAQHGLGSRLAGGEDEGEGKARDEVNVIVWFHGCLLIATVKNDLSFF
jgi:hypothetical protein